MTTPVFVPSAATLGPDSYPDSLRSYPALMPHAERLFLFAMVVALAPRRVLEIGTAYGGSALIISEALRHNPGFPGKLVTLDPVSRLSPEIANVLSDRNVDVLCAHSPGAIPQASELAGGMFDLVFVDGEHDAVSVCADVMGAVAYLSEMGWMLVHDAHAKSVQDGIWLAERKTTLHTLSILPKKIFWVDDNPFGGFALLLPKPDVTAD